MTRELRCVMCGYLMESDPDGSWTVPVAESDRPVVPVHVCNECLMIIQRELERRSNEPR